MKKTLCIIIMLCCLLLVFTGCFDAKSIENYAYVIAIGIDKSESSNIKLSMQIAHSDASQGGNSSQSTKSSIVTVDCKNIEEGISIINNYSTKKLNLSHCTVIAFSKEFSQNGIDKYITSLINNNEIRPTCNVIISNKNASEFLNASANSGEEFSSRYYEYILNSSDYSGFSTETTLVNFFSNLTNDISAPIAIYSDISNDIVQNIGLAVFKEGKFIANTSTSETISYLILKNKLDSTIITITNPFDTTNNIPIKISLKKQTQTNIDLINNSPYISINIFLNCQILDSDFKGIDSNTIKEIENTITTDLSNKIETFLYKLSASYDTDICNFGHTLRKKYLTNNEFQKIHWAQIFKSSTYKVSVKSSISDFK